MPDGLRHPKPWLRAFWNRAYQENITAAAIGGYAWEKAGRIWYETLRDARLKPNTHFNSFARITYTVAQRLYGNDSYEAQAVKYGWDMVGISVTQA